MENHEKSKAIFLDRDGVLNAERGEYTYRVDDFEVIAGVPEALKMLKEAGFLLIIITNQGGIAKGLYSSQAVWACHEKLQKICGSLIDALYYAPSHPSVTASLSRKPDSLMLEKAISKFNIDPDKSWLIGDRPRDLEAAAKVGVPAILVGEDSEFSHPLRLKDLLAAATYILSRE